MALLSATQGTPERVYSLVRVLSAHGGGLERNELFAWLNPRYVQEGQASRDEKSAADQTIQAALSLKLIDTSDRSIVRLLLDRIPASFVELSDLVHAKLSTMSDADADAVLFEVLAWLTLQIEIEGSTIWVNEWSAQEFADRANEALTADEAEGGDRRFNSTKRAPWRRWIEFVGLSTMLPTNQDYPCVTSRLRREIGSCGLPFDQELDAHILLGRISQRMPYLDGGRIFEQACRARDYRMPPRKVSRFLSVGLRDLEAEGVLKFVLRGDARENYELASDRFSKFQSFGAVVLSEEGVADG